MQKRNKIRVASGVGVIGIALSLLVGLSAANGEEYPVAAGTSDEMLRIPAESPNTPELDKALQIVGEISEEYPEDYALAYVVVESDSVVIGFRGTAPEGALAKLRTVEDSIKIEENFSISEVEIKEQISQVGELALEFAGEKVGIEVAFLSEEFKLEIVFSGVAEIPEGIADLTAEIAKITPLPVEYRSTEVTTQAAGYGLNGGTTLVVPHTGEIDCTSAFVAKKTSGTALGLLTAGHCGYPNYTYFNEYPPYQAYNMPRLGPYAFSNLGDYSFYHSSKMMDAWFQYVITNGTPVGSPVYQVRNPIASETICRFGMRSKTRVCGVVQSSATSKTYSGVFVTGLARIAGWASHGDSGGPVHSGTIAVGLTAAANFIGDNPVKTGPDALMWLTVIKVAENGTGTKVCREPVSSC